MKSPHSTDTFEFEEASGCSCKGPKENPSKYFWKMCDTCAKIKPYMVFKPEEGYFWGPGSPWCGQKCNWSK